MAAFEEVAQLPTFFYFVIRESQLYTGSKWNTLDDAIETAQKNCRKTHDPYIILSTDRRIKPQTTPTMENFKFDWDVNIKKPAPTPVEPQGLLVRNF